MTKLHFLSFFQFFFDCFDKKHEKPWKNLEKPEKYTCHVRKLLAGPTHPPTLFDFSANALFEMASNLKVRATVSGQGGWGDGVG